MNKYRKSKSNVSGSGQTVKKSKPTKPFRRHRNLHRFVSKKISVWSSTMHFYFILIFLLEKKPKKVREIGGKNFEHFW